MSYDATAIVEYRRLHCRRSPRCSRTFWMNCCILRRTTSQWRPWRICNGRGAQGWNTCQNQMDRNRLKQPDSKLLWLESAPKRTYFDTIQARDAAFFEYYLVGRVCPMRWPQLESTATRYIQHPYFEKAVKGWTMNVSSEWKCPKNGALCSAWMVHS